MLLAQCEAGEKYSGITIMYIITILALLLSVDNFPDSFPICCLLAATFAQSPRLAQPEVVPSIE